MARCSHRIYAQASGGFVLSMDGLGYRLGQVELEEEIHYSSRGGVLGTVAVDIEVTKDHLQTMARIAVVK